MMAATEDPEELKRCMKAFEQHARRFYTHGGSLEKRRQNVLPAGQGRYIDEGINARWMAWQACWNYLVTPSAAARLRAIPKPDARSDKEAP